MKWTLRDHGESLEKEASVFVSTYIPFYEKTWASFIGHQGNGVMAQTEYITNENERVRKNFAEHHYSVLESLYFMYKLAEEEQKIRIVENFDEYRKMLNSFMAFYAYGGRVRDNLLACYEFMGYPLKNREDPTAEIKELYNSRNTVLHYKKMPFKIDKDGLFLIPKIGNNSYEWNRKSSWADTINIEHEYISDSMMNVFFKVVPKINKMFSELFEFVEEFRKKNNIVLAAPEHQPFYKKKALQTNNMTISGTNLNVSGVMVYGYINPKK